MTEFDDGSAAESGMIISLKDETWLKRQKRAGETVSSCLREFAKMMKGKSSLNALEIEECCAQIVEKNDCVPTFFNYQPTGAPNPFPGKVCLSVNEAVVHGVPKDYQLKDGDVVTLDLGATFEGAIADAAFSCIFGKTDNDQLKLMLVECQKALFAGVNSVEVGKRTGSIGNAIFNSVKPTGFGLITDFGGHGLDYNTLHAAPFIENKARQGAGVVMEAGLSIAIEPMLTITKNTNTKQLRDNWTIVTKGLSCHYEHSVTLSPDGERVVITDHGMDAKDYV